MPGSCVSPQGTVKLKVELFAPGILLNKRRHLVSEFSWESIEAIVCPKCRKEQLARAYKRKTDPWPTYMHTCEKCGYEILESEWEYIKSDLRIKCKPNIFE